MDKLHYTPPYSEPVNYIILKINEIVCALNNMEVASNRQRDYVEMDKQPARRALRGYAAALADGITAIGAKERMGIRVVNDIIEFVLDLNASHTT